MLVAGVGVGSYRVYDTAALNPGHGQAYEAWQHWRDDAGPLGAVAAAILAANPHNTQPWLFQVTETAVDVFLDPGRNIGSVDPYRREQHVGLGCALENLALACRARGLSPDIAVLLDGPDSRRVAHVALTPTTPQRDDRYDAIGTRHTNRGPYQQRAIPTATLAALVDTTGLTGVSVQWIVDPAPMATLNRLLVDAAEAVAADEDQSRDGFAWFRSNDDAIQTHRDGLTLDAQGLSPLTLGVANTHRRRTARRETGHVQPPLRHTPPSRRETTRRVPGRVPPAGRPTQPQAGGGRRHPTGTPMSPRRSTWRRRQLTERRSKP